MKEVELGKEATSKANSPEVKKFASMMVSDHGKACMAAMAKAVGFHSEDVDKPSEIVPALKRALDENARGRPAFVEFLCSHHPVHGGWVRSA